MLQHGPWIQQINPRYTYQYNSKDLQNDSLDLDGNDTLDMALGWYDYGARFYDPSTARWTSMDSLAEKTPGWSTYHYTLNNPIRFIDPDGMAPQDVYEQQEDGSWKRVAGEEQSGSNINIYRYNNGKVAYFNKTEHSLSYAPNSNSDQNSQAGSVVLGEGYGKGEIEAPSGECNVDMIEMPTLTPGKVMNKVGDFAGFLADLQSLGVFKPFSNEEVNAEGYFSGKIKNGQSQIKLDYYGEPLASKDRIVPNVSPKGDSVRWYTVDSSGRKIDSIIAVATQPRGIIINAFSRTKVKIVSNQ